MFFSVLISVAFIYLCHPIWISLIYNHFGNSHTLTENDSKTKKMKSIVDKLYYHYIKKHANSLKNKKYQEPLKVAEISVTHLNRDNFSELTQNFTKPLIVRDFATDTRACKEWNLEYFDQNFGSIQLPVISNASVDEAHQSYVNEHKTQYEYLSLSELIKQIKEAKHCYLNNVSRIFGLYPKILEDMELDNVYKYTGVDIKNNPNVSHMFFGSKGTGSTLHSSITGNFFYNVKGQKNWILVNPRWSKYLLPNISKSGLFAVSHFDILNAKEGDAVLNVPRYEFQLNEGDLLFNPPWWWHAVKNESDYVIGCANRFTNYLAAFKNNPLYSFIFFTHPFINNQDFNFSSKQENNLHFDKSLLRDIVKSDKKVE